MSRLKEMLHLVRSAERLTRRIQDPATSQELFARLCVQHHLMQRRWYALSRQASCGRARTRRGDAV